MDCIFVQLLPFDRTNMASLIIITNNVFVREYNIIFFQTSNTTEKQCKTLFNSLLLSLRWIIELPLTVNVDFLQHRPQLLRSRELSQGTHNPAEFFFRDSSIAVLVKQPEGLPEFCRGKNEKEKTSVSSFNMHLAFFTESKLTKITSICLGPRKSYGGKLFRRCSHLRRNFKAIFL